MRRKGRFISFLEEKKVVLFDGAMGTMLYQKGIPKGHCYDELNISNPSVVKSILKDYIDAGADVITTNTFGANRFILEKYYDLGNRVKEINQRGVEIAREVAGDGLVAGSVGPISRPAEVYMEIDREEMRSIFEEQIEVLIDAGVDLIIFETFADIDELTLGIEVAKSIDEDIPIIAEMTFLSEERTLTGLSPHEVGIKLSKTRAEIIGVNCGTGPRNVLSVIKKIGQITDKSLSAMPNAGYARFEHGKFIYPYHPDYFANYAKKFIKNGVSIIGGCCGTTPAHIRAMKKAIEGLIPSRRKKKILHIIEREERKREMEVDTTLKSLLRHKFVISVEVDPPKGPDISSIMKSIRKFKGMGVDAINVSDNPMAQLRMSPAPFAYLIKRDLGLEVILHITCRDRNVLGLQSDLLGYSAMGLDNVLILTGDPPSLGDYPFATGVYDVNSKGLISIINSLNSGMDFLNNPLNRPTNFFVGMGASSCPDSIERELRIVEEKIERGAHFIQTQPVFDIECFRKFYEELKKFGVPVIAGLMPITGVSQMEFLINEVPGIKIPDEIVKRIESSVPKEAGIEVSKELLEGLRSMGVSGVCIMPMGRRYGVVEGILL